MIQQTYLAIINGQIAVSADLVIGDRTAFEPQATADIPDDLVTETGAQLIRFADQPDGTVSGKSISGHNDDLAMALMLAIYWRICVKSAMDHPHV
jgi:hypothetical protein